MTTKCPTSPPAGPAGPSTGTPGRTIRLGRREWPPGSVGIMAVINRTPGSFFDQGTTYDFGDGLAAAGRAVPARAGFPGFGGG